MVKNFTRKDLSKKINKTLGFSKNFSSSVVDNFFDILKEGIIKSEKFKITSFGTFKVTVKKERLGRNPKTKKEAKIVTRKVITFKPSFSFKERINK